MTESTPNRWIVGDQAADAAKVKWQGKALTSARIEAMNDKEREALVAALALGGTVLRKALWSEAEDIFDSMENNPRD